MIKLTLHYYHQSKIKYYCSFSQIPPINPLSLIPITYPQHLNSSENRHFYNRASHKSNPHSHNIDRQLELQEFFYAVVDISSPHNGFHDTVEIIVQKNNVAGFTGHLGPCDSHGESDVGFFQSGGVIGTYYYYKYGKNYLWGNWITISSDSHYISSFD